MLFTGDTSMRLAVIPLAKKWQAFFLGSSLFMLCYLGAAYLGIAYAVPLARLYPDHAVPFISWTIWIYVSDYVFLPLAFFLVTKPEDYSGMLYSMAIATLIACIIFIYYPTLMYREPLSDSPADSARALLYLIDLPTNCFPSLHVALSTLAAFFMCKQSKMWGIFAVIWACLIAISTMTVKQHYFADVIGGALLAVVALLAVRGLLRQPVKAE